MIVINSSITDELVNKVRRLTEALRQAEAIVESLEKENKLLFNALTNLTNDNKEEHILDSKSYTDQAYVS